MWIIAVGIFGANLSVAAMDQDFRLLIDGNAAGDGLGLCLSSRALCGSGVPSAFDLPTTGRVLGYMLILSH